MGLWCVLCTAPDMAVTKMHDRAIEPPAGLRMMMFGAGTAAGAFPADLAQSQVKLNSC